MSLTTVAWSRPLLKRCDAAAEERPVFIEDHNWWTTHVQVSMNVGRLKVGLKYEAIGGMAPWRDIWNSVEGSGEKPLLRVQP